MIFTETKLAGAFVVAPEKLEDIRGFFAQTWSEREFAEHGIQTRLVEANTSFNRRKGTLRGMHFQTAPHAQAKLVRCTAGAIYDVIIDLRPSSRTFKQWVGVELTAASHLMLYVPEGFAHGFQTLLDATEVFYQVSDIYAPEYAGGVRWNDPAFDIRWPEGERIIIPRDEQYPDFNL
ncbi:MAG TPA: dTDP-4-dehydrorhamnose 3,5-epimerase [Pyrinomonadaceae bacterium]|jgi:dTDP-4-dehydrorhamnose 3,5-epimerase